MYAILEAMKLILLEIRASLNKKTMHEPEPIPTPEPVTLTPREILYNAALSLFNTDASPADRAPDDLACAETVNEIHKKAFGIRIEEEGLSTTKLYQALLSLKSMFLRVVDPLPGDIIISPTGYGTGAIRHGHVGIVSEAGMILSNDSNTGNLTAKYNIQSWVKRYKINGGFPVVFFRRV